jgi:monoamine oxidase
MCFSELLLFKSYRLREFTRTLVVTTLVLFFSLWITAAITSAPRDINVPALTFQQDSQASAFADQKVIVIGAGAAGVFAGYTLQYLGIENFEILEASPTTFGGRTIQNDDFVDIPIDLGAEWIHGDPKLLKDLLLFDEETTTPLPKTIVYQPQTYGVYKGDGKIIHRDWIRFFYSEAKFWNTTWFSYLQDFIYPYVQEKLVLDAAVKTIDYSDPDTILVTTRDGQVREADYVILAVPISILQNETILELIPTPPKSKVNAIQKVEMAVGLKAWLEFETTFWLDVQYTGSLLSAFFREDRQYFDALFRKPSDRHVLALFHVGDSAWQYVDKTDDEIIAELLNELDDIFQGQATKYYIQSKVQNWYQEPFIQGAYSYNWYEYWDDVDKLREPIGDHRIYFAGEYLADYTASVHGAAISGRQAVQRLVQDNI